MKCSCIVIGCDGSVFLKEYLPLVDVVVEEECCYASFSVAVDNSPIDRCSTAVAGQQ